MARCVIQVYLTKSRQPIADVPAEQQPLCLDVSFEGNLGTWPKTHGNLRIIRARKAASRCRLEWRRYQRFPYLGGTAGDGM
jgi:hypothetical protein